MKYILISYSTGQILEDDQPLHIFRLRPYELLEIHSVTSSDLALPRNDLLSYIQPFFEVRVKALRVTEDLTSVVGRGVGWLNDPIAATKDKDKDKEKDKDKPESHSKKRKLKPGSKLEWRDRWVIIQRGVLTLCKDRASASGDHQHHHYPLNTLVAIRGSEYVRSLGFGGSVEKGVGKRVLCIKFSEDARSEGSGKKPVAEEKEEKDGDEEEEAGEWVVVNMLDEAGTLYLVNKNPS